MGNFNVFLSHNSKDKPVVRQLGELLKKRGLTVWLDEWELAPGQPWQQQLEQIITTTQSAAVLVGADGLGPWEEPEMRACLAEFVNRKLPVIPVLLPDAPDKPTLPLFLKAFTWVDFRGGITNEALNRLQWGITGIKPDSSALTSLEPSRSVSLPNQPARDSVSSHASSRYGLMRLIEYTKQRRTTVFLALLVPLTAFLAIVLYQLKQNGMEPTKQNGPVTKNDAEPHKQDVTPQNKPDNSDTALERLASLEKRLVELESQKALHSARETGRLRAAKEISDEKDEGASYHPTPEIKESLSEIKNLLMAIVPNNGSLSKLAEPDKAIVAKATDTVNKIDRQIAVSKGLFRLVGMSSKGNNWSATATLLGFDKEGYSHIATCFYALANSESFSLLDADGKDVMADYQDSSVYIVPMSELVILRVKLRSSNQFLPITLGKARELAKSERLTACGFALSISNIAYVKLEYPQMQSADTLT
jgi:hypothetical protein